MPVHSPLLNSNKQREMIIHNRDRNTSFPQINSVWCPLFLGKGFFFLSHFLSPLQIHTFPLFFYSTTYTTFWSYIFFSFSFCLVRPVLLGQGYFSKPRNNSSWVFCNLHSSIPERTCIGKIHLILHIRKYTCDPSYPERENEVFQVESYCLRCLIFSHKTDSAALWLGDRTKSLHLDCGDFTCVTCFTP